jgi:hypothetical protein
MRTASFILAIALAGSFGFRASAQQEKKYLFACHKLENVKKFIENQTGTHEKTLEILRKINDNAGKQECVLFNFGFESEPLEVETIKTKKGDFTIFQGRAIRWELGDASLPINPVYLYFVRNIS